MKKPVQVYITSVLKACRRRNYLDAVGNTSTSPAPATRTTLIMAPLSDSSMANKLYPSRGNPCLDLFYNAERNDAYPVHSLQYLNQLLPAAWAHNPTTTIKLICNLLDRRPPRCKNYKKGFDTAAFWLHHNHPKTLACNLPSIAGSFGSLETALDILSLILQRQDRRLHLSVHSEDRTTTGVPRRRQKFLAYLDRYQSDPDYRFLHDRVSDIFADCLKFDIQNFNKHQHQQQQSSNDGDEGETSAECLEITSAAKLCPDFDSPFNHATLLCESIAKKVFPRKSYPEYQGIEEADYTDRVRQRLREEVLVPLGKALMSPDYSTLVNRWGYNPEPEPKPKTCAVEKYLEKVKAAAAAGKSKIKACALLPHHIARYVKKEDFSEVAELHWKAMVEHMKKQGKFKNCLAVYDNWLCLKADCGDKKVARGAALAVMISELSEEPWKGKLMNCSVNTRLHSLKGLDNLKAKLELAGRMEMEYEERGVDFEKLFDLVLEVAVKNDLKPEQMIRRVVVFSSENDFDGCWKTEYEGYRESSRTKGTAMWCHRLCFGI
ncbi:uncharacterized protein Pyn_05136 [Prunus yedoensis var. nudiflora]|uniref:Uncharacterized protein n=1 Tax=Prunus yedoensis var. nudiflora TaxID=2094558 RepID=A0A315B1D4_PRUYE|nr:uncharacterized protein Pyn_05136 [Prunus yedoensis var. nudiflora]